MAQYEQLLAMAEDELTQYSTDARKIEKLRRKIALTVPFAQQREIQARLEKELPDQGIAAWVEKERQTIALPFWGVAGLGLLLGISLSQPFDFIATVGGIAIAYTVQKWGWRLQAKRLLLITLQDIQAKSVTPSTHGI
ncbi:hypothetical protein [Spirulina subsalsa]|uniref:hypothetical protein n=1 Tax=Spirulina subsalsa TaxID=54311 RepID=UPI0003085E95|nr:hypothetical protein [Spirulina subsalsa]